ncbi:MAG: hypothetical protein AAFS07_15920 [Pseudomonadota bacterium]
MRPASLALLVLLGPLALAGCGTVALFGEYDVPESPDVADAPYPRLVDVPEAPAPGAFTDDVPDPAEGVAITVDLTEAARQQNAAAAAASAPVLTDADRRALGR